MSFFSRKPELAIIFHIGSSSIGAGIVELAHGKVAQVLYTVREDIPYRDVVDPGRFLNDMIDTLKRTNARLAQDGLAGLSLKNKHTYKTLKPERIFYVFSSPWAVTQTKIATINKPEGFTFTKTLVDNVIAEQERIFETEVLGNEHLSDKLQAIEKRIVQIELNGYEIADPYGKKATRADISLFMSLIPKAVIDRVFDVSMSTYHPRHTEIFSFPLASFSTIRDVFHNEKDFIFIDIGGELSDISVVRDGLILETASFPLGRHFLIRKIAETFQTSPEGAVSLVKMYHDKHADTDVEARLEPVIKEASLDWSIALHQTLTALSLKVALPSHLFAIINNDFVDFFMKALKEEKVTEFGTSETPLFVVLVNHDKLRAVVEFAPDAYKDPFIAILAGFAHRVYESKTK